MTLAPECSFKWEGVALATFLGAIPLAILITVATLFLYRWAVGRAMRTVAREAAPVPEPIPSSAPSHPLQIVVDSQSTPLAATPPNLGISIQSMRSLNTAYILAGLTHTIIATLVWLWITGIDFRPFRALLIGAIFIWPVIAALMMTATTTRRQKVLLVGAYFMTLLLLEIITEAFHLRYKPGFGELFIFWVLDMGFPTLVIALLANRAWRAVGLTALFVAIVLVGALLLGFPLLGCAILTTRNMTLATSMPYLLIAVVLACGALAWLLLRRAARRYQAKQTSDQMLTLDSWWLLVTAIEILFAKSSAGIARFSFLLAFIGYKFALHLSLRRFGLAKPPGKPQSMLLLRVFGNTRRARSLTDQVSLTWRHAGPINMIGGTDLATALIEPDELMAFWSGKLRQGFVTSPTDLENRLQNLDEKRDPDGRYRINEFFCYDNTWRATVHALAQRSSVVLMDLRGFGKDNRGCEFELAMLLSEVPLARVVLLVDRSTRIEVLKTVLQSAWQKLPAASPNRELAEPVLHLFIVEDSSKALRPLLERLFSAAT